MMCFMVCTAAGAAIAGRAAGGVAGSPADGISARRSVAAVAAAALAALTAGTEKATATARLRAERRALFMVDVLSFAGGVRGSLVGIDRRHPQHFQGVCEQPYALCLFLRGAEPVRFPLQCLCLGDLHRLGMFLDGFVDLSTEPAATFAPADRGLMSGRTDIRTRGGCRDKHQGQNNAHQPDRTSLHGSVLNPRSAWQPVVWPPRVPLCPTFFSPVFPQC